jgi:phosphatidylinositol alpha-1,6-mannosyltransferase
MPDGSAGILIISRNFPPLVGGMERLLLNAYRQLNGHYRCDVIAGHGSEVHLQSSSRGRGCPVNPAARFLPCAFVKGLAAGLRNRYRVYFAGSGVTAPLVVILARLFGGRSLVYLHGLDIIADHWLYQHAFVPFFRRADRILVNSRNTAELAKDKGVPAERIRIIHPGVDLPELAPDGRAFIERHGLSGARLLLSVGRIIPRKGLAEFVTNALPEIVRQAPDCRLVVIGGGASEALKRSAGAVEALTQAIASSGLSDHVVLLGNLDDAELSAAYAAADVLVFPLRQMPDDVEGFGMVAVEAAAQGLPTVAFDVGGVADAIDDGVSGELVRPADYRAFAQRVVGILATPRGDTKRRACVAHAARFSWSAFGEHLRAVVGELSGPWTR